MDRVGHQGSSWCHSPLDASCKSLNYKHHFSYLLTDTCKQPRGDIDDRVRYIVNQLGYTPAMWSVDSQDWRITAGGQTEAGLLADVTKWANSISTLTEGGGNSLMHDLNNVTVGAALKSLPILHPKIKLAPVGECAGWKDASYLESAGYTNPQASASAEPNAPAASQGGKPTGSIAPAAKGAEGAAVAVVPAMYATALVSLTALISSVL